VATATAARPSLTAERPALARAGAARSAPTTPAATAIAAPARNPIPRHPVDLHPAGTAARVRAVVAVAPRSIPRPAIGIPDAPSFAAILVPDVHLVRVLAEPAAARTNARKTQRPN